MKSRSEVQSPLVLPTTALHTVKVLLVQGVLSLVSFISVQPEFGLHLSSNCVIRFFILRFRVERGFMIPK